VACGVTDHTAKQVERISRKRSGIETTYRLIRQARGITTTRDPVVRFAFVFMLVAAILENLWLVLRWTVVARAGAGAAYFVVRVLRLDSEGARGAVGAAVGNKDEQEQDRYSSVIPSGRGLTTVSPGPAGLPLDEQQLSSNESKTGETNCSSEYSVQTGA